MSPRIILNISKESWNSQDPQLFHQLLLLKLMLMATIVGIPAPLLVTIFVRKTFDHVQVMQILMWCACLIGYLRIKQTKQVFVGSFYLISTMAVFLFLILISSKFGDLSGAYHHIVPMIIAASFLLGVRIAFGFYSFFMLFYMSIATGLWHYFFPGLIAEMHPGRVSVYTDRCLEITFCYGLAYIFNRVKRTQQERLKDQEKEGAQKEKLLSINRLAGGIAHEINNPLAILLGYLELLERYEFNKKELDRITPRINLAAKRIQFVVWSLNQLNKQNEIKDSISPLEPALRGAEQRLRGDHILQKVKLTVGKGEDIQILLAAEDLQNVIYSILLNAMEAVEQRLDAQVELKVLDHDDRIKIEIWDNGGETSIEELQRFTEPFYTTKLDRPGRGMGLTLISAIISRVDGKLSYRQEGPWTVASISIPGRRFPLEIAS